MHLLSLGEDWGAAQRRSPRLSRRAAGGTSVVVAIVASVVGLILLYVVATYFIRRSKKTKGQQASSKPQGKNAVSRFFNRARGNYAAASSDDEQAHQLNSTTNGTNRNVQQTGRNGASGVDRNTSVRSVMTLPAYSHAASHNEQVLGREGERDGIDVIVDLPTQETEEELRDNEMEAMYQLRVARRQHIDERDTLRRQREDAQSRRDTSTVSELRTRSRDLRGSQDVRIEELRAGIESAKQSRQRSASSVSYADLGVARHDGTRLRANSHDEENVGLLSDSASIAAFSAHSRAYSPSRHQRGRSNSSINSIDSDFAPPVISHPEARSRSGSQPGSKRSSHPAGDGRAGSSPEMVESDLGVVAMPPPEYEDVSLDDDDDNVSRRFSTALNEPPPNYPGPSSDSREVERPAEPTNAAGSGMSNGAPKIRGVGGVPQLPSLRIGHLPQIIIEPSSANPQDEQGDTLDSVIGPERTG